jgi:hypothetical protein
MRANEWEEIVKELKIKRKTWREDSVSPASFGIMKYYKIWNGNCLTWKTNGLHKLYI